MKKYSIIHWIDGLIVLLNIAAGRGNYLLYWFLHVTKGTWVVGFVILIDIIYLLFRISSHHVLTNFFKSPPILLIFLLLFYNIFNKYAHGETSIYVLEILFAGILFYIILLSQNSLFKKTEPLENRIKYFTKGYVWISFISIIGVFLSFVLLSMGYNYDRPITADFFEANADFGYGTYVLSFFSVNFVLYSIRIPFFQDYGYLCGLYHEPHALTYGVFPCLILLLGIVKKTIHRIIIVLFAILIIFFTVSAANILALLSCTFVFLLLRLRTHFFNAFVLSVLTLVLIFCYLHFDDTIFHFVLDKLNSDNTSRQASKDLLMFAFTPRTFMGTDFLSTSFVNKGLRSQNQDIGFIAFFLFMFFLILFIRNIILLLLKKDNLSIAIGLASLYFIIHSSKIGMPMFIQTTPILLIFLQSIVLKNHGRVLLAKKN